MLTETTAPVTAIPHSREAEEALLGSILVNPDLFNELGVPAQAFYIHRHQFVWQAYQRLIEKSRAIDLLTVSEELDDMGRLDEIGGPSYLVALLNQVPTTLNAGDYAEIVREHHARRLLLSVANDMAKLAYSADLGTTELLSAAEETLRKVSEQVSAPEKLLDITEVVSDLYDDAIRRAELARDGKPITSRRIATGLTDVDTLLKGGLRPGSLNIIAGRPGQGKSAWMQTVAMSALRQGNRVGFFSLEMTCQELAARIMASASGLDANLISEGLLMESQWEAFITALEGLHRGHLFMSDLSALTPANLRAQAYQLQSRHGLDLLVVDYLQLMRPGVHFHIREQEVAYCSRELKLLAGELRIPVLAAAQLNRASEVRVDGEPILSDVRESGAIENDADVVAFIWRPDPAVNISRLKLAKHRGGPVGSVNLFFDAKLTRFANLERKEER